MISIATYFNISHFVLGDCCGNDVQTTFCSACQCLACKDNYPGWWGDGICDDGNNNEGCNWDGGDCCMGASQNNNWCTVCACLDPNGGGNGGGGCGSPQWKGDGYCDDDNNNQGCDYDGGKFLAFELFMTIVLGLFDICR